MKVGDLVVFKGQRKGSFQLGGGYVCSIDNAAVVLVCDSEMYAAPLSDLEPFTAEYVTTQGNMIVKRAE